MMLFHFVAFTLQRYKKIGYSHLEILKSFDISLTNRRFFRFSCHSDADGIGVA